MKFEPLRTTQRLNGRYHAYHQATTPSAVAVDVAACPAKEKSKHAARSRREKENVEFVALGNLLPLPADMAAQLDKASIIRLTTSYLRMRNIYPNGIRHPWGSNAIATPPHLRHVYADLLPSLDGFVFVLAADGKIAYISETAARHLGLSHLELTGNSVYDYVCPDDHAELVAMLAAVVQHHAGAEVTRTFALRMKCVLPKRDAGITAHGYRMIRCSASSSSSSRGGDDGGLVVVGEPMLPPRTTIALHADMFVFRAGRDLKLIFVDESVTELLGYEPHEMIGKTLYKFVHPNDILHIQNSHQMLLAKGQATTRYFRLLHKNGGWSWIQSQASVLAKRSSANGGSHSIVCVNYALSEREATGLCLNETQCAAQIGDIRSDLKKPSCSVPVQNVLGSAGSISCEKLYKQQPLHFGDFYPTSLAHAHLQMADIRPVRRPLSTGSSASSQSTNSYSSHTDCAPELCDTIFDDIAKLLYGAGDDQSGECLRSQPSDASYFAEMCGDESSLWWA